MALTEFSPCVCNGANQCPGCNEEAAADLRRTINEMDARREVPPCLDCGAVSADDARGKCICGGDRDDCHGCYLWPDDEEEAEMTNQLREVVADALPRDWQGKGISLSATIAYPGSRFSDIRIGGTTVQIPNGDIRTALATLPSPSAGVEELKKEVMLRWLLARTYSGTNLYCDDGEMSDSSAHPAIDFLRDELEAIESKMHERTAALRSKQPAASEGDVACFRMIGPDGEVGGWVNRTKDNYPLPILKTDWRWEFAYTSKQAAGEAVDSTFAEWLASEMPAGTVIGDPTWWANRIARQYQVHCTPRHPADEGMADALQDAVLDWWHAHMFDTYSCGDDAGEANTYDEPPEFVRIALAALQAGTPSPGAAGGGR